MSCDFPSMPGWSMDLSAWRGKAEGVAYCQRPNELAVRRQPLEVFRTVVIRILHPSGFQFLNPKAAKIKRFQNRRRSCYRCELHKGHFSQRVCTDKTHLLAPRDAGLAMNFLVQKIEPIAAHVISPCLALSFPLTSFCIWPKRRRRRQECGKGRKQANHHERAICNWVRPALLRRRRRSTCCPCRSVSPALS